jgi:alpha-L-arabinofuranosidase
MRGANIAQMVNVLLAMLLTDAGGRVLLMPTYLPDALAALGRGLA